MNDLQDNSQLSDTPRVSVIIPAYNTAQFIGETLSSVFSQTYRNYEVIVVNDCSPDTPELERVLAPYIDRIRYLKTPRNGGLAAARNAALRIATSELIALLDSDDVWPPDSLATQVAYLTHHPGVAVVYGDALYFGGDLDGRLYSELFPSIGAVTFESVVARRCNVMGAVVARREPIVEVGLFDDNLRSCEDFELWCRLLKFGYRIEYHDHIVLKYRRRLQSLSANEVSMLNIMVAVHEKFRDHFALSPSERAIVDAQIGTYKADALFYEGKRAFIDRDFQTSVLKFKAANAFRRRPRITLITQLLHVCPRLLHWAYVNYRSLTA